MDREALITAFLNSLYDETPHHGKHRNARRGVWVVLYYLYRRRGEDVFPGDLCQELDVTTPRVTSILNELEHEGLIQRVVHESDRRKVRLTLTEEGLRQIELHTEERRKDIERLIDRVGEANVEIYLNVCNAMREERHRKNRSPEQD